jgi:hypothetical protein
MRTYPLAPRAAVLEVSDDENLASFQIGDAVLLEGTDGIIQGYVKAYLPHEDKPFVIATAKGDEHPAAFTQLTLDRYDDIEASDSGNTVQTEKRSQKSRRSAGRANAPSTPVKPTLLNLTDTRRVKSGPKLDRAKLCADILAQFRDPAEKAEVARTIDRLPINDLPSTLESIHTQREWFMVNEFNPAYGEEVTDILSDYYRLYGACGFGSFIAIDDCDLAKFTRALGSASAPQSALGPAAPAVPRTPRAPLPIVEGSCRKLMGTLLVTCKPNAVGGLYTVSHGGDNRGKHRT